MARDKHTESFGIHENSIERKLEELDPEIKAKYHRNRKLAAEDARAMDSWASQGFTSMPVSEESDD